MGKHVVVTAGPIPARLDSVKFLTNRFKGGLSLKLACALRDAGHDVTVVKWRHAELEATGIQFVNIEDVMDYYESVQKIEADAYVLAAAVANLTPVSPWTGKFPSHKYKVREQFDIPFMIAPRVIDELKRLYPRSTLIGYKLFDGHHDELISAARETLVNSRANAVFANHPATAKTKKWMVTQDYATLPLDFDEHVQWVNRFIEAKYYKTSLFQHWYNPRTDKTVGPIWAAYNTTAAGEGTHRRVFGTFAVRLDGNSFITTSRGKREDECVVVKHVDHQERVIMASNKATMNAPLLAGIFERQPEINVILHDHKPCNHPHAVTVPYAPPGTVEEADLSIHKDQFINIQGHGYIAKFKTAWEAIQWQESL
jgi:hypothetical protein